MDASEKLVNTVSLRSREDALKQARKEVENAQEKLIAARSAILEYRNKNVTIDPIRKADEIGKLILELTLQRLQAENMMAAFGSSLSANAPSTQNHRSRIQELDKQINELKQRLTTTDSAGSSVTSEIVDYERLKLSEQFAEKLYTLALTTQERALQKASQQQLYLSTVVRPTMPEKALYPERAKNIFLSFMCMFVIWGIVSMLAATVFDHLG